LAKRNKTLKVCAIAKQKSCRLKNKPMLSEEEKGDLSIDGRERGGHIFKRKVQDHFASRGGRQRNKRKKVRISLKEGLRSRGKKRRTGALKETKIPGTLIRTLFPETCAGEGEEVCDNKAS